MKESGKPFFPEIFEEKMRKCDEIDDNQRRRDCKISILEDAVKKIGANQKPVQWWLEVIAEGTKPLFDEIRNQMATKQDLKSMATKDDLDSKFNALEVRLGKMRSELVNKEDFKNFKSDVMEILEENISHTNEKIEKIIQKIDTFDVKIFKALGMNNKSEDKK